MTHRFLASLLFLLCLGVIAASVFAIVMAAFHYAQLAAWNELPEVIVLFTHSPIQGMCSSPHAHPSLSRSADTYTMQATSLS